VKYSEAGATVDFAVERDGQDAVCVVRDRGIGISENDQQQLFKAFHRGENVGDATRHRAWPLASQTLRRTARRQRAPEEQN
jgi:signal transduction histidine kinase